MRKWLFLILGLVTACSGDSERGFQGYIEADNLYLASPGAGFLQALDVHRGEAVTKGKLLYTLDPQPELYQVEEQKAKLRQAERTLADLKKPKRPSEIAAIKAQIKQTDAKIKLAALRVKRYQKLQKQQAADKDTVDSTIAQFDELVALKAQYQSNLDLAAQGQRIEQINAQQATVDALRDALKQSEWALAQKSIYAPTDGVIFDTFYRQGEWVAAQKPVVALLAPEHIRVEFFVPVKWLSTLHLGSQLTVRLAESMQEQAARVSYISPEAEYVPPLVYSEKNYNKLVYRIKAIPAQPEKLKPGQPVSVFIHE